MGVCVNCGGALEDRWKFCIFCGTPVSMAPIGEPTPVTPVTVREPDAEPEPEHAVADPEPELAAPPELAGAAERAREPDADAAATAAAAAAAVEDEPGAESEPSRPPIPSAIRSFVPVDIPNEDEDEPATRHIRPRLRPRRVDIPLLLGIALGVAGIALIIYMIAVLSGQG